MTEPTIRVFEDADETALVSLWREAQLLRPWNDPVKDIALCRATPSATLLVADDAGGLAGSVMAGSDGHRGWIYYLAVARRLRGRGLGRRLLARAEAFLAGQGIAKVQFIIREENVAVGAFYRAAGYAVEPRIMMSRRLDGEPRPG